MDQGLVQLCIGGRTQQFEYAWHDRARAGAPLMVFLHDGLGSLAAWKDFPHTLCRAVGVRGLVFSRDGYGRSTARPAGEKWPVDFMHRQAVEVLPALLSALGADEPPWLFGHSDGGSIALLYAAAFPERVAGLIVVAPHVFVEDVTIRSIEEARRAYATTDLRARLARYHDDPDSAFGGWSDVWLDPDFRAWNIEAVLPAIRCPVLAVQGEDDVYGTMAQIDAIGRQVAGARLRKLARCGHSPQRDQPAALTDAVVAFVHESRPATGSEGARARA